MEPDITCAKPPKHPSKFQSTGSVWSPTPRLACMCSTQQNFNPRAPCGARRLSDRFNLSFGRISIHGLRVEPDDSNGLSVLLSFDFNPRAPCGARHAAIAGELTTDDNFNPRAPCGARLPRYEVNRHRELNFNPRAPCGARRSGRSLEHPSRYFISIHGLRVEPDYPRSR